MGIPSKLISLEAPIDQKDSVSRRRETYDSSPAISHDALCDREVHLAFLAGAVANENGQRCRLTDCLPFSIRTMKPRSPGGGRNQCTRLLICKGGRDDWRERVGAYKHADKAKSVDFNRGNGFTWCGPGLRTHTQCVDLPVTPGDPTSPVDGNHTVIQLFPVALRNRQEYGEATSQRQRGYALNPQVWLALNPVSAYVLGKLISSCHEFWRNDPLCARIGRSRQRGFDKLLILLQSARSRGQVQESNPR